MPEAIGAAPEPIRPILESMWNFVASNPDLTDEQRVLFGQALTFALADVGSPETASTSDVVDAVEALAISGYRSDNSIRHAVATGKLPVHHERVTPGGHVIRYFLRSDVERLRDQLLAR